VAGYCEYGDELSGSGATELVTNITRTPILKIRIEELWKMYSIFYEYN
jgi:hypothetical protein